MLPLLIVKLGDAAPELIPSRGDYDAWIIAGFAPETPPVLIVDPRRGETLPPPAAISGVVLTGSDSMVTEREAWSEETARWLTAIVAAEVPLLGICYGHQLLAHALGGAVIYHPQGIEIGSVGVSLAAGAGEDALFGGLPEVFPAHAVHSQTVARLPPGATVLAANAFEPHHAFRVGRCAWGVQFHPEFSTAATLACIDESAARLRAAGVDIAGLKAQVTATPAATSLLTRFARLLAARHGNPGR